MAMGIQRSKATGFQHSAMCKSFPLSHPAPVPSCILTLSYPDLPHIAPASSCPLPLLAPVSSCPFLTLPPISCPISYLALSHLCTSSCPRLPQDSDCGHNQERDSHCPVLPISPCPCLPIPALPRITIQNTSLQL